MTTPNNDLLHAHLVQILVDHPVTPPTYAGDFSLGQKRDRTAQVLAEFVDAAVKRGQAEAWAEGMLAGDVAAYHGHTTPPNPYEETPDEQ